MGRKWLREESEKGLGKENPTLLNMTRSDWRHKAILLHEIKKVAL